MFDFIMSSLTKRIKGSKNACIPFGASFLLSPNFLVSFTADQLFGTSILKWQLISSVLLVSSFILISSSKLSIQKFLTL